MLGTFGRPLCLFNATPKCFEQASSALMTSPDTRLSENSAGYDIVRLVTSRK